MWFEGFSVEVVVGFFIVLLIVVDVFVNIFGVGFVSVGIE